MSCRRVLSGFKGIRFQSTISKLETTPNEFNSRSSAFNLRPKMPDGFFHHPAPASTNPKITPKAFLPPNDTRVNDANYKPEGIIGESIEEILKFSPSVYVAKSAQKYNLSKSDVEQIQKLRDDGLSRSAISKKFGISNWFIGVITKQNSASFERQQSKELKDRKKWGKKTLKAQHVKNIRESHWERNM
ncbi:hypothetical protein DAMA08_024930 [Martiniozyma asiatica (nom. inval.)]|nr:hypothetical protein DAMA08_024930 [Martiniozyma asiatica]